ncbi:MAG: hypothetical protein JWN40_4266 [Phycisphaerales bacterium]|nr:hypothetical protein [Phycisphaerales bacterium]
MHSRIIHILAIACLAGAARADDAIYERSPIKYLTTPPRDPVAQLQQQIDSGQIRLDYDPATGYLPALLRALNIPISSQVLVFSKTSFQRDLINPAHPRALYFNDDVYVGFVQGGDVLEIASTDPRNGPNYYTLRQRQTGGPTFVRQTDACLQCHASSMTNDMPGHLVRSVFPDGDGQPILSAGTFRTNPTSPLKQRWGGWYVTGTSGPQVHMGNVISADKDDPEKTDFTAGSNLKDLAAKIDTSPYPSPHSDIVALMTLEHQAHIHNLITRANFLTRLAMHDSAELNKALGRPAGYRSESTISRIDNAVEPLLKGMLFCEETKLTAEIAGTSGFAKEFSARGPRDQAGRSLRDLDLKTRMFKYPCSYLIYSESFDALPAEARDRFFVRLHEVLNGQEQSKDFAHLTAADRKAISEILAATKKM